MAPAGKPSGWAIPLAAALAAVAMLVWVLQVTIAADLGGSDPAGNAIAQGYAALEAVVLWILLAALTVLTLRQGAPPRPAAFAALLLMPASGYCTIGALDPLARPDYPPFLWPIVVPAVVPPLVIGFCFWALIPSPRARVPAAVAAGGTWGATLLLCLAVVPMQQIRERAVRHEAALRATWRAAFAGVPSDAPLWRWTPFLAKPDYQLRDLALARIRHQARRQSDAETMLARGDFPLGYLGRMDLDPTPALCGDARLLLSRRAEALVPATPGVRPYSEIAQDVADAVSAMDWLVGYGCACEAESRAWESAAKQYRGTNFDVIELARLRDPERLGRTLREHPAKFAMLTPAARLQAWLGFADDKEWHEQALAGARRLGHRAADAIAMLGGDDNLRWTALRFLPVLDLDPTPALCEAARAELDRRLAQIYRPREDDPRPYRELLERLGGGGEFPALLWLAEHGCAVQAELGEAEVLVRAYRDGAERAAMLGKLAALRRRS